MEPPVIGEALTAGERKMSLGRPLFVGLMLMFTASYIDNLRGPLLPLLKETLGLDQKTLSYFLIAGHLAAIAGTTAILFLFNRFREENLLRLLVLVSGCLALLSLYQESLLWFLAMGASFGFVNTMLGTFSNIWVMKDAKSHSAAKLMCGLHMLYGLGSLIATSFFGALLEWQWNWRIALLLTWPALLVIFFTGEKDRRRRTHTTINVEKTKLGFLHLLFLALFATYVASEVTTSMWLCNYLHKVAGKSLAVGSFYTSCFFLVMTISRGFCAFIAIPRLQIVLLWSGVCLPAVFHALGHAGYLWAFALTGLYGPFFPVLMARIKHIFPEQWRSMTTWVGVAVQCVLALIHFSVGSLADRFGIGFAYYLPLWSCLLLLPLLGWYLYLEKRCVLGQKPLSVG